MKKVTLLTLLMLIILNLSNSHAQNAVSSSLTEFTEGQLAQMLAPIALYPDTLLSHILIASTYPIEIVQAHRWLKAHEELSAEQIFSQVADKDWDPSIKALLPFPLVLKRLNDDLTWTNQLGDAFLADEGQVLSSIQQLRQQADLVGNLNKMENVDVNYEGNNIIIQPLQPEVVYVPYYDSRTIYGYWNWHYYPPVYWSYPRHYVSHQPYYWHSGVHISFNYFFSAFHWHSRHLVVINHHNSQRYVQKHRIVSSQGSKRWHHKPHHRRGVAYSNNHVTSRYKSTRVNKQHDKMIRQSNKLKLVHNKNNSAKSRYNLAASTKHSKTMQQLNRLTVDKKTKHNSKQQINNNHRSKYQTFDKKVTKPVANDKMRRYTNESKQVKKSANTAANATTKQQKSYKVHTNNSVHKSYKSHKSLAPTKSRGQHKSASKQKSKK